MAFVLVNQLKDKLLANLNVTTSLLGLPPVTAANCIGPGIISNGFKGKNDLTLNLSNPVFSYWHNYLDSIGSSLVQSSQSWELPFISYKVSGKSILFNINREAAIPLLLLQVKDDLLIPSGLPFTNCHRASTLIILNTAKVNIKPLTRLRFQYIEDTLVSSFQSLACEKIIRRPQTQDCDPKSPLNLDTGDRLRLDYCSPLEINIDPYRSYIPYDVDESQFIIEPDSRLMSFLRLFNELLVPNDLHSDGEVKVIVLIHINDWKIGEKAITSWSILTSLTKSLKQITFIPIADITCDLSVEEIKSHWRCIIEKQSGSQYTEEQVNSLVETCLRFIITSISSKVFHTLDLTKYKEALFIQYNYARLIGITKKFQLLTTPMPMIDIDLKLLKSNQEWNLIYNFLAQYQVILSDVLKSNPIAIHRIPYFLKTFVNYISIYYNFTRVITEMNDKSLPLANARIVLIDKIRSVIHQLMSCIKIDPVQYM